MKKYTYLVHLPVESVIVYLICSNRYLGYDCLNDIHRCTDFDIEYVSQKGLTDINLLEDSSQFIIYN